LEKDLFKEETMRDSKARQVVMDGIQNGIVKSPEAV